MGRSTRPGRVAAVKTLGIMPSTPSGPHTVAARGVASAEVGVRCAQRNGNISSTEEMINMAAEAAGDDACVATRKEEPHPNPCRPDHRDRGSSHTEKCALGYDLTAYMRSRAQQEPDGHDPGPTAAGATEENHFSKLNSTTEEVLHERVDAAVERSDAAERSGRPVLAPFITLAIVERVRQHIR